MNVMNTPASTAAGAAGAGGSMTTEEIKARIDSMFAPRERPRRRRASGLHKLTGTLAA
ncbi:hypothetical protein [Rhodococcus sp. UNC363MFTsu5.1]|uniref:hypothetical protein n=1 Tax=Rhodococcus sp. UNC363MFTsu5.1 TaxID=1449069 RepID=UPI0012DC7CEA|nr:hypothetical protein [Rhodococcus sp. UNC363MFTsu5.1]